MAASNASSGSFGRRRNQPGQENGEETKNLDAPAVKREAEEDWGK
jgi:hypothetical protein